MKTPRLFTDQPLQANQIIELDRSATRYITRVLRRNDGDHLTLFNGDGSDYSATLITTGKTTQAKVVTQHENSTESPLKIRLVQSLAKGSKLDLVIQKATELGVSRITPVSSDRSVLQIDQSRLQKRMEHWRGIAISACSQCQRSTLPVIDEPRDFNSWLESSTQDDTFMLHPEAEQSLGKVSVQGQSCTMIVGPEGGFSREEIDMAMAQGVTAVTCGPRILRTETAGFTAIAILQSRFGDLA